ncbi:MAG: hypothetical protein F6K03_12280 [Kamptonema sp. SIO4C4]|nr:hypothetical protein [Kamptonema sp. SIO4C4]
MEWGNFLAWIGTLALVVGGGIGAMIWAYVGSGSTVTLFSDPILFTPESPPEGQKNRLRERFDKGVEAFRMQKYRQAKEQFLQVVRQGTDWPEAYHNLGLAFGNLRQIDDAVASLVQASEYYGQQDRGDAIALIKQHLQTLKAYKEEQQQ